MKGRYIDVNRVENKINNCLEKILSKFFNDFKIKNDEYELYIIVLAHRWKSTEFRVLTSKNFYFRGKKYNIIPGRCGDSFLNLLQKIKS